MPMLRVRASGVCLGIVLPAVVRERLVGFRHAVDVFALLHGAAAQVGRVHQFVRELNALGYSDVSTDDLVSMRIHNVTTEFVRDLKELGFRDMSVDDLVSMRIHNVTTDFARKVRARDPDVTSWPA